MSDFISELFKRYGIKSVIFSIIFSVIIWIFAHFAASPGTEVSILWGLVRYTKSPDIHQESATLKSEKNDLQINKNTVSERKDTTFLPISLFVKHNLAKSAVDQFLLTYRKENNVREIQTLESGKRAGLLSDGIYAFTSSTNLLSSTISMFETNLHDFLLAIDHKRYRSSKYEFEIHFINKERIILLGFVNKKDASDISFLSGKNSHEIILSPLYFGDFITFVAIPIERIIYSKERIIEVTKKESYWILDVTIK